MRIHKSTIFAILMMLVAIIANAQEGKFFTHTVSKGQTLYSISRMYGTTVDEIIRHNPECAAKLSVGHELRIPQNNTAIQHDATSDNNNATEKYHTIKSGETLYRLGKMYGITTQAICDANPGLSIENFKAGEVILIPQSADKGNGTAQEQVQEERKITFTTHKVKRREDREDICALYGITDQELIAANPEIIYGKLKKNMILKIPVKSKSQETNPNPRTASEEHSGNEILTLGKEEDITITPDNDTDSNESALNVALILPFLLDSYAPNEQVKMVEYYQGFLMAVKKLKEEGYSFKISTFDSGHMEESLDSLLSSGALDKMDIIIGALYQNHNKELASFAKKNSIPLVIPFTSKEDEIFRNPMVYVVNSMQSYIIPEAASQFVNTFPNANVIFIEDGEKSNKKDFIATLTEELDKNGITHTTQPLSNLLTSEKAERVFRDILVPDKDNILIPSSSSSGTLNTLLPTLVQTRILDESHSLPEFKLFGYPEWQIYAKDTRDQLYELDTYFYVTFYSHYSLPEDSKFQNEFISLYNRNIQNTYPRYGMLGYDTGYLFLLAASKYGKEMHTRINELDFTPIQSGFKFERVNNWGGLINKKIYFIHYTRDYNIEKIDFDK
ncbi:MAG: LysM peptidoglycan-binding domain-containing protein [Bacteroidaceae bacterium]|nr:LysM peptidoglycan-binding domain-containing protein [Bacteroidaceae bacterium]